MASTLPSLISKPKATNNFDFPLKMWEGRIYPYSSYNHYLSQDHHSFCNSEFILAYFSKNNPNLNYQSFVEENEEDALFLTPILIDFDKG